MNQSGYNFGPADNLERDIEERALDEFDEFLRRYGNGHFEMVQGYSPHESFYVEGHDDSVITLVDTTTHELYDVEVMANVRRSGQKWYPHGSEEDRAQRAKLADSAAKIEEMIRRSQPAVPEKLRDDLI